MTKLELYGLGLILLLAVATGVYFKGHHDGVESERAAAIAEREKERERTDKLREESDHAWQDKFDFLQTRVTGLLTKPSPAIRMCEPEVRLPQSTGQPHAETDGGQIVRSGPDLSAAILVFASQCERDRQQLTELQTWIEGVTKK